MGQTPDRHPGPLEEDEEIQLSPQSGRPTANGNFRYVTGVGFRFYEEGEEKGLSGTGVSEAQHRTLRQLIHLADAGGPQEAGFATSPYCEVTGTAFPTVITWWDSSSKTKKLVEETIEYNTNKTVKTDGWVVYDAAGNAISPSLLDTYAYSGGVFVSSVTRTFPT